LKLVNFLQFNGLYKKLDFYVDAGALLLGKASFVGLRLAALYMLASRIPRETFGAIAFGLTIAEMSRVLGDWGGDTLGLHRYSNTKVGAALSAFHIGIKVRFLSSIVTITTSIIAIYCFTNIESKVTLVILSLMTLTSLWLNTAVNWLQARGELRSNVWPLLLFGFTSLLAQYFLSQANAGINMHLVALFGFELCIVLFLIVVVLQSVKRLAGSYKAEKTQCWIDIYKWLRDAAPIAGASILAVAYTRVDQVYIAKTCNASTLGSYTFAVRLIEPLVFVAAALSLTIYSRAAHVAHERGVNSINYTNISVNSSKNMLVISLGMAIVLTLLAAFLIPYKFSSFSSSRNILFIFSLLIVFRVMNLCCTALIQAAGGFKRIFFLTVFNMVYVPLCVIIGGWYHKAHGVAFGVVLAEATNFIIQARMLYKIKDSVVNTAKQLF